MSATTNTELKDKLTLLFGGFGTELLELDRKYGDKVDAETEQEELKLNELYVAEVLKLVQAYCEQRVREAEERGRRLEIKDRLAVYSEVSSRLDQANGGTGSATQRAIEQIIKDLNERLARLTNQEERPSHEN